MLLQVEPDLGYEAHNRELGMVVSVFSVPCSLVAVSGPFRWDGKVAKCRCCLVSGLSVQQMPYAGSFC